MRIFGGGGGVYLRLHRGGSETQTKITSGNAQEFTIQ